MALKYMFLCCLVVIVECGDNNYKLEQVVALGRHSIRAPLTDSLGKFAGEEWPVFGTPPGILTEKGALMETYLGKYIGDWLRTQKLLKNDCPSETEVFIYANTKQRTIETAKHFAKGAFSCDVPVYHNEDTTKMDPLFNSVIHNRSKEFLKRGVEEMQKKIEEKDLKNNYAYLNYILDFNSTVLCKNESYCDFGNRTTTPNLVYGEEPEILGPIYDGSLIADTFLMSYYDGKPIEEIGWDKIDDWPKVLAFLHASHDVRFNVTFVAKDLATPLLKYIHNMFNSNISVPFTLLIGHDANLYPVLRSIGVQAYPLPGQFEFTPIGGIVFFEKWLDLDSDEYLFRINYVYPTMHQLREGSKFSDEEPPGSQVLEIENCKLNANGFGSWSDFNNVISQFN